MPLFKCKMCGAPLNITDDTKIIECGYCGSVQTLPSFDSEKKTNLLNLANDLRLNKEFDKAAGVFESIVGDFPDEPEAYWGLCLCKYGIDYVDDPNTGEKIPTCHRTCYTPILNDSDFVLAYGKADILSKKVYLKEAEAIDHIQKKILEIVSKEDPYDIFICYKDRDDSSKLRTEDSSLAQDIYTELIKEGYKVFFSRITLKEKAGEEYEPYIYAALSSAKVMLAIGTKAEHYNAIWVKNEWSRYLAMMDQSQNKWLIPCFKNMDTDKIPTEMKNLQALNIADMTFFTNLKSRIAHYIKKPVKNAIASIPDTDVELANLFKRAEIFLRDENFEKANEYYEKILDRSPEEALAYWGKVLCKERCIDNADIQSNKMVEKILKSVLGKYDVMLLDSKVLEQTLLDRWGTDYQNALRFADDDERSAIWAHFSHLLGKLNDELAEIQKRTAEIIRQEEEKKREEERIAREKREAEIERERLERQLQEEEEERIKRSRFLGHLFNLILVAVFGYLLFSKQLLSTATSTWGAYAISRLIFFVFALIAGIISRIGCGLWWPLTFVVAYPIINDFIAIVQDDIWGEYFIGAIFVFAIWMALSLATAYIGALIFGMISGTRNKK